MIKIEPIGKDPSVTVCSKLVINIGGTVFYISSYDSELLKVIRWEPRIQNKHNEIFPEYSK